MEPAELSQLKETLPCRSAQIEQLHNLIGHNDEPLPDTVYLHGGPSVGKSIVVETLLHKLCIKHAIINLIECYTSKILFESILGKLCSVVGAKCDNMMDFANQLKQHHSDINRSVLVIDKAERLRTMDFNLFQGFFRLRELAEVNICVFFLSEIALQKYFVKSSAIDTIRVYFPQYTMDELLEILSLNFVNERSELCNSVGNRPFEFDMDFYRGYLNAFLPVFFRNCRDLSELRCIARANFGKYCQPVVKRQNTVADSVALWRKIVPELQQATQGLYLRIYNDADESKGTHLAQNIELPFYAKYLLIASYLASYNPAKDDKRLFMKYHGKERKSKRDVNKKSKVSEQLNTQLGPKTFNFDRLLAIFFTILGKSVGFNSNLLIQVSSLVELQLLSSLSDNSLDGPKYKCNVTFDFIQSISKMVGFNIRKYLSDFSHL